MKSNLKDILDNRGIKYGFISEKVGVSRSTVSQLINNKSIPTLPVALKIAKLLELKIEDIWIMEEDDWN